MMTFRNAPLALGLLTLAACTGDVAPAARTCELMVTYPADMGLDQLVLQADLPDGRAVRAELPDPPRPLAQTGETLVLALPEGMRAEVEVEVEGFAGAALKVRGVARLRAGSDVAAVALEPVAGCASPPCDPEPVCGDGVIEGAEACDDDNAAAEDGCSPACAVESGWVCAGAPSVCTVDCVDCDSCGDGAIDVGEACDDGARRSGDGCNVACQVEPGYACEGEPSVCAPVCGDGLVIPPEGCDDDGTAPGDGCSAACEVEVGFGCVGQPSACAAICGDGRVLGAEGCDDRGLVAGDGCGPTCEVEDGYACVGEPSVCSRGERDAGVEDDAGPSDGSEPADAGISTDPAVALRFGYVPATAPSGQCATLRLERVDAQGNSTAEAAPRLARLVQTDGPEVALFSQSGCGGSPITSLAFPAGVADRALYLLGGSAGAVTVQARADDMAAGAFTTVIQSAPADAGVSDAAPSDVGFVDAEPADAGFADAEPPDAEFSDAAPADAGVVLVADHWALSGAGTLPAGRCAPMTLQRQDASGAPAPESRPRTAALAVITGTGLELYADAACAGGQINSLLFPASVAERTFYLRSEVAEQVAIRANSVGLAEETWLGEVSPGPPSGLSVIGGGPVSTGACTPAQSVALLDAFGNVAVAAASRVVDLTVGPAGVAGVYDVSDCGAPAAQVTIAAGASAADFFVRAYLPATFTVDVSVPGLTSASAAYSSSSASCASNCNTCGAGACCNQQCGTGSCAVNCPSGCSCNLDCDATTASCGMTCNSGAYCGVDCRGAGTCDVTCNGGSECVVECDQASNGCDRLRCMPGASCMLVCGGATNCGFGQCPGGASSCPGDIVVCNRACP